MWLWATFVHPEPEAVPCGALLTAASPTAATVFVMAERAERFPSRATIVLVTRPVSLLISSALLVQSTP